MPEKLYSLSASRVAFRYEIEFFTATTDKVDKNTENAIILVGANERKIIFSKLVTALRSVFAYDKVRGVCEMKHKNGAGLVFTSFESYCGLPTENKGKIKRIIKNLKYTNL